MTTLDFNDTTLELPARRRTGRLIEWFRHLRHWRTRHLTVAEIGRLNPHMLRDMGIEPQDVIDAIEGRNSSALFEPMRRPDRD